VGRNPSGGRARPNSQHPRPHSPAERMRPSRTVQPSQPSPSSQREAKQSRGSRPHDTAPGCARPTPTPTSPVCARACPGLHPNARSPSSARQKQNRVREKLSPTKPITGFSPNPQQTRHESSIRLEEISGTMHRPCWTLWPTNRSPEHPPPPNTFPHCRSSHQTEPSAPCQFKACRAAPSPEGGSPSRSAAAGADSTAGAPPEDAPTAVEDRPSRLCVASFPPSVSATVSDQNEFLSTSRLRRSLRIGKRSSRGRARSSPPSSAMSLRSFVPVTLGWRRKTRLSCRL
jgi:hypothetical protein